MKMIALALLTLTGCMTPDLYSLKTPRPQVVIAGAKPEQVKANAVAIMLSKGWLPISTDPLVLTFEKELPFGAQIFLREVGAQPAKYQMMFTIVDEPGAVRIVGSLKYVSTRWGKVQVEESHGQNPAIQRELESIRCVNLGLPLPPEPEPEPLQKPKWSR